MVHHKAESGDGRKSCFNFEISIGWRVSRNPIFIRYIFGVQASSKKRFLDSFEDLGSRNLQ